MFTHLSDAKTQALKIANDSGISRQFIKGSTVKITLFRSVCRSKVALLTENRWLVTAYL